MIIDKSGVVDGSTDPKKPEVKVQQVPVSEAIKEVPVQAAPLQDADGSISSADIKELLIQNAKLVKTQLERENRAAKEDEDRRAAVDRKTHQRDVSAQSEIRTILEMQKYCTHLKGGKNHLNKQKEDYNVSVHTFIDGPKSTRVKCLSCRMKWMRQDTPEFLVRNGRKIPNHTGIGWQHGDPVSVMYMLRHTSNTITKSEVPINEAGQFYDETDKSISDADRPTYQYEV